MGYVNKVGFSAKPDFSKAIEFLAVGVFQDKGVQASHKPVDEALGGLLADVIARKDFRGKKGDSLVLFGKGSPARVALIGLGEYDKFTSDLARQAAGTAVGLA
ncbi:MAG: hypothetical protein KAU50_08645, partial [Candidatus Marinimicrobia bacterium]|nr:hypothetical protein [Candidatus Neomarinimicrobiota bacterium]